MTPPAVPASSNSARVTIVAILREEDAFVAEWVAYHQVIGVERFILYDNDPRQPLAALLARFERVEVVPWFGLYDPKLGSNPQLKAYEDSLTRIQTPWVAFIDGDEFITLRQHVNIGEYLAEFAGAGAVRLAWHLYGHNGHYNTPRGLITELLTQRRRLPSQTSKSITRVAAIESVADVHACTLKPGYTAYDARNNPVELGVPAAIGDPANINHYMCRSFQTWMKRVSRGHTHYTNDNFPRDTRWHFSERECLKQFVTIVSKNWNEVYDPHMLRYADRIRQLLAATRVDGGRKRRVGACGGDCGTCKAEHCQHDPASADGLVVTADPASAATCAGA